MSPTRTKQALIKQARAKQVMLKQRSEFLAVKSGSSKSGNSSGSSSGSSWGTPGFLLQAVVRQDMIGQQIGEMGSDARFGVTVTNHTIRRMIAPQMKTKNNKASSNKADLKRGPISVLRNKMRRRLKEALRQIAPDLAQPGIDYVIIGRQACLSIDYADLLKDLEKSFKKVHRRIISSSTDTDQARH